MIIAAAAFSINPCCGLEIQLNICIGNTENSSIGLSGANGTYAKAPTTISGAVSPTARDSAKMTPVNIPPADAGKT